MMPGDSFRLSFGAPGTYDYFCTLHPEMRAVVVVTGDGTGAPAVVTITEPTTTAAAGAAPTIEAPPAATATAAGGLAAKNVRVVDNDYEPGDVRVQTGQEIRWTNVGEIPHTVTAEDRSFDSGIMATGAEFRMSFDTAGTYAYFCTLHPDMVGTITVVDPPPPEAAAIAPVVSRDDVPLAVAVVLSMAIVVAMGLFTLGMTRFAKAADEERGVTRRVV
jgi:plastocyanin